MYMYMNMYTSLGIACSVRRSVRAVAVGRRYTRTRAVHGGVRRVRLLALYPRRQHPVALAAAGLARHPHPHPRVARAGQCALTR